MTKPVAAVRPRRSFVVALSVAAAAPAVAGALTAAHVSAWIAAAERAGVETTDWGFTILFSVLLMAVTLVTAACAVPGWVAVHRRGARLTSGVLVAGVDVLVGVACAALAVSLWQYPDAAGVVLGALEILVPLVCAGALVRATFATRRS